MSGSFVCVRCGRALKGAESVRMGMGPVCAGKAAKSDSGSLLADQPVLNDVGSLQEVGLVCRRLADGRFACNVPQVISYHSPGGFAWGYPGSGPADLALNVLHFLLPPKPSGQVTIFRDRVRGEGIEVSHEAERLHQEFKWTFLTTIPEKGGIVPIETIRAWLATKLEQREAA